VNIVDATATGRAVLTATNAAAAATAVGLGTTNTVTFADVAAQIVDAGEFRSSAYNFELFFEGGNGLAQNGNNIFTWTSTNASFPVPVSFATNVTVGGTLAVTGNVTLSGVNNTAPAQTADSGSSLMTRDLRRLHVFYTPTGNLHFTLKRFLTLQNTQEKPSEF
jgi:hypothetical protein